jgi:hypothetical protein
VGADRPSCVACVPPSRSGLQHQFARRSGFGDLVAPVRPTLKHRYPLTSMERYLGWAREDGLPLDPWIRVHARLDGVILHVCSGSMTVTGTVAEWETWTGMAFPETGSYVVEGALVPVEIDRERDLGTYVEPNLWMRHRLAYLLEASAAPQGRIRSMGGSFEWT